MPYREITVDAAWRTKVRAYLDPVQAARQSLYTARFDADLPTLCHRVAMREHVTTDWAFALWLDFRTYATRGNRRGPHTPNFIRYRRALKLLRAQTDWPTRTIHRRLRQAIALGFMTLQRCHGHRCLFWKGPQALLTHLRATFSSADDAYYRVHWLARKGDRYQGASERRTFLPEVISLRSRADLRAAMSAPLRIDSSLVHMGRTKQAAILGMSYRTGERRVKRSRKITHERVRPQYHELLRVRDAAQRNAAYAIINAARQAEVGGDIKSPLLLKQVSACGELTLVRQLPSISTNPRIKAFTGNDYPRRFARRVIDRDLRPVRRRSSLPTVTAEVPGRVAPRTMSVTTTERQYADQPVVEPPYPEPPPTAASQCYRLTDLIRNAKCPIHSLHRFLVDRSVTVRSFAVPYSQRDTYKPGDPLAISVRHFDRDAYTEAMIHSIYDWDPSLVAQQLGINQHAPAPPKAAYRERLHRDRPTLGYMRRLTGLRRPRRQVLLRTLGPMVFTHARHPRPTARDEVRPNLAYKSLS
jgi:hypothetical protein